jgi:ribosomal protein S14
MKREISNAKNKFPSTAPEGNLPGVRKTNAINLR